MVQALWQVPHIEQHDNMTQFHFWELEYDPISLWVYPQRNESRDLNRIHSSTVHKSRKLEATQASISR